MKRRIGCPKFSKTLRGTSNPAILKGKDMLTSYDSWKLQNPEDAALMDEAYPDLDGDTQIYVAVFEPNQQVRVKANGWKGQITGFNADAYPGMYKVCFGWDENDEADEDIFSESELESV